MALQNEHIKRTSWIAFIVFVVASLTAAALGFTWLQKIHNEQKAVSNWRTASQVRETEWFWVSSSLNRHYTLLLHNLSAQHSGNGSTTSEDILNDFDILWGWFFSLDTFDKDLHTLSQDSRFLSSQSSQLQESIFHQASFLQSEGFKALEEIEPLILAAGDAHQMLDELIKSFENIVPTMGELQRLVMRLMRDSTIAQERLAKEIDGRLIRAYYGLTALVALLLSAIGAYLWRTSARQRKLANLNGKLNTLYAEKSLLVETLDDLAHKDALSHMLNRTGFQREIDVLLQMPGEHGICFIDLDRFKVVNDSAGHAAGDKLIQEIGAGISRLCEKTSNNFRAARYGGDEFVVICESVSASDFEAFAVELSDTLQPFPFNYEGKYFDVTASVGAFRFTAGRMSLLEIMSCVDAACFEAKQHGGSKLKFFTDDNALVQERISDLQTVELIQNSLERNRFTLFQQPIVKLTSSSYKPYSIELLIRMLDSNNELVPPGKFLPVAERYGLMPRIDSWVVREALRWLELNDIADAGLEHISINLSGLSISDDEFVGELIEMISGYNVSCEQICFEVTESASLRGAAKENLLALDKLGIKLSLDDFGSGYSSFGYLEEIPVSQIKIDGAFIQDLDTNTAHQEFVRAIAALGKALGKSTVGEFVENEQSRKLLWELGVVAAQGYHIAKPTALPKAIRQSRQAAVA